MAVDSVRPGGTQCAFNHMIQIRSLATDIIPGGIVLIWCVDTYFLQLFGNIGGVLPQFGPETLSQHQGAELSREACLGALDQEL